MIDCDVLNLVFIVLNLIQVQKQKHNKCELTIMYLCETMKCLQRIIKHLNLNIYNIILTQESVSQG